MLLNKFSESELRNASKEIMETLEHWLRRIVDMELSKAFGSDYFNANDGNGDRVIKKEIVKGIEDRYQIDPNRYGGKIDASLLDTLVDIICNPRLYQTYFRKIFEYAFPEGNDEARTFFKRLIVPRNHLSHANPISIRQVEQVICYSHDIIDSIKEYYKSNNMQMTFNVPRFVEFKDSFGNEKYLDLANSTTQIVNYINKPQFYLRPGDYLSIEMEVDESFNPDEYTILWRSTKLIPDFGNVKKINLKIENHHVTQEFNIQCVLTSKKEWHRRNDGSDDLLLIYYTVMPPI